jgi:hypothetical protein
MQQRLQLLQAEEQRRHRQYQQVEQQLQAVLAMQQEQLSGMHAARSLLRRSGLQPWLSLSSLRGQQWQLATRQHQWHLLSTAMTSFKHGLVCRCVSTFFARGYLHHQGYCSALVLPG